MACCKCCCENGTPPGECCGSPEVCCKDPDVCCGPSGSKTCCEDPRVCCGVGSGQECCPEGDLCCGEECCPEDQECCGEGEDQVCCNEGQYCCDGVCEDEPCEECTTDEECATCPPGNVPGYTVPYRLVDGGNGTQKCCAEGFIYDGIECISEDENSESEHAAVTPGLGYCCDGVCQEDPCDVFCKGGSASGVGCSGSPPADNDGRRAPRISRPGPCEDTPCAECEGDTSGYNSAAAIDDYFANTVTYYEDLGYECDHERIITEGNAPNTDLLWWVCCPPSQECEGFCEWSRQPNGPEGALTWSGGDGPGDPETNTCVLCEGYECGDPYEVCGDPVTSPSNMCTTPCVQNPLP
jgi:hypothetical protein